MFPVSDEYLNVVKGNGRVMPARIKFDGIDGYFTNKQIKSGRFYDMIDGNSILSVGNACANKIEMTLVRPNKPIIWKGSQFAFEKGLVVADATEWVPWGSFWITDMFTNDIERTIDITAYDYMYHLSKMPYKTALAAPFHYRELLDEFLSLSGMTLSTTVELPDRDDEDYMILRWPEGEYSFSDMAGHLAGMILCNAHVSRADPSVMEFKWWTPTATKIDSETYTGGFEKLADSPVCVDILATGANKEIVIENTEGSTAGALDFSQFDIPAAEDLPMFAFTFDTDSGTASCALNDGYEASTDKMYIPTAVVYQGVVCYITSIPADGFRNCKASAISLPYKVQTIGSYAFSGCTNITSLEVPATVTSVASRAFSGCTSLASVRWNPVAVSSVGSYTNEIFDGCSALTDFTFADDVTVIPAFLLRKTPGPATLTIPAGVTKIGNNAFDSCNNIQTVYWNAVKCTTAGSYSNEIFKYCSGIKNFVFADDVTIIPGSILRNTSGPAVLTIPAAVTKISDHAFEGCSGIQTVYWNAVACTYAGSYTNEIFEGCTGLKNFIVADGVTTIPALMLRESGSSIETIVLPDSVKTVNSGAFLDNSKLTRLQIGESANCAISSIASDAFGSPLLELVIYKRTDAVKGAPWGASAATITWLG